MEKAATQQLLNRAKIALGNERYNAVIKMAPLDLHRTHSVAYQQFRDDIANAMKDIITAQFMGPSKPYQEYEGRIAELRSKKLSQWSREELDEWFELWGKVE